MTKDEQREFAKRLVRLREQRSLSQKEAAELVGVSHRQYARWEAAGTGPGEMPRVHNLRKLAHAYKVHPLELTGGEAPTEPGDIIAILTELRQIHDALKAHNAAVGDMYDRGIERDLERHGQLLTRIEKIEADRARLVITWVDMVDAWFHNRQDELQAHLGALKAHAQTLGGS